MVLLIGGGGIVAAHAQTKESGTTIHQEIDFPVQPARIYEALLNAKQFSAFSNAPAQVTPQAGEPFKLFAGQIEGRNVELIPNQRIVQAWRPISWPAGVYSIVRFELVARNAGTRLVFDHTGFPEDKKQHLSEGWESDYWGPLRKYLKG